MEELSSPALRDGSGEKKPVSVFGEERSFVLRRQKTAPRAPNQPVRLYFLWGFFFLFLLVTGAGSDSPAVFSSRTCLCNQLSLSSSCF